MGSVELSVELCVEWGAVGLKERFCEILSPNRESKGEISPPLLLLTSVKSKKE